MLAPYSGIFGSVPGYFCVNGSSIFTCKVSAYRGHAYIYVSLQLSVQNAASAQPCVVKLGISLVLLIFLDCNFRLWFETP